MRKEKRKNMKRKRILFALAIFALVGGLLLPMVPVTSVEGPVSGALFTTDDEGLLVNGNIYRDKRDVYISGGPGPNAPPGAAGLPDGEYYFQVTDPSGKKLLSTDDISERHFRVHGGIIVEYLGTINYKKNGMLSKNQRFEVVEEIVNEFGENAIVIQLYPYKNTPNKGGVYKVWATPVEHYDPDDGHSYHGFIPRWSKTDNYKIKRRGNGPGPEPPEPSYLELRKFYDLNLNGVIDTGEPELTGWLFEVTDPLGVINYYYSPRVLDVSASEGTYTITEIFPTGTWIQMGVSINGLYQSITPTVTVTIQAGETHVVKYLNIALGYYGGGHTPGYWHNNNGQAEIGQDDLDYVNGLNPFQQWVDFYPSTVEVPFPNKEEIADFLVGNEASETTKYMRYKLAKFFLAMELNVYNGHVDPALIIYLGPGDFQEVGDVLTYVNGGFDWSGWTLSETTHYKNALDAACNNDNFVYPTPPPIVY
jgi:hypothetical protein